VQKGTFANIAIPTREGGEDCMVQDWVAMAAQEALQLRCSGRNTVSLRCFTPQNLLTTSQAVAASFSKRVSTQVGAQGTADVEASKEKIVGSSLFPYRFYGQGSYFGELECILGKGRLSTVRCESVDVDGDVLILKKRDYSDLVDEFPQFGEAWASAAWRREAMRLACLKGLTKKRTCRHAAAARIQREFRAWRSQPEETDFPCCSVDANSELGEKERNSFLYRRRSVVGIVANRANSLRQTSVGRSHINFHKEKMDSNAKILREIQSLHREIQSVHRRLDNLQAELNSCPQSIQI